MLYAVLFFCFMTIGTACSEPEVSEFSAELFGKVSAHHASTAAYDKEAAVYKQYLKILGAPLVRAEGLPSVRRYLSDSVKFIAGGAFIGAVGALAPSMAKSMRLSDYVLTAGGMVVATGLVGGMYGLNRIIAKRLLPRAQAQKMKDFLYSWPQYRAESPALIRLFIEPYYKQLAVDGVVLLSDKQLSSLYTFLAATINARLREIRAEIVRITAGKKRTFLEKMKAISW